MSQVWKLGDWLEKQKIFYYYYFCICLETMHILCLQLQFTEMSGSGF